MSNREYPPDPLGPSSAQRSTVPSPCINVCEMDSAHGLCKGCARTIDEIASWSMLDDATKLAVLDGIVVRRRRKA